MRGGPCFERERIFAYVKAVHIEGRGFRIHPRILR